MRAFTAAAIQVAPVAGRLTPATVKSNVDRCVDLVERCVEATGAELRAEPGLYRATVDDVVDLVRLVGADAATVAVVGHNPTVHQLVGHLAGPVAAGEALPEGLGTAGVVVLQVPAASWARLAAGDAHLLVATRP